MPVPWIKKDTNYGDEDEDKIFLEGFIKYGFLQFSSKFEDIKAGKISESSSFAGNAVGITAGGIAAGASIFLAGGAGAATAGTKVKSMTDTAFNFFGSEKFEKERKNILSWTCSVGKENEKQFLETVSQGLAYICVAFKDQIRMFHQHDANIETFFNDVFRRVFKHMKENPRNGNSPLTPEEYFIAFTKGRSTPQRVTDQFVPLLTKLKKSRGMHLAGIHGDDLNTQELFETPGYIVPEENQEFYLLSSKDSKKGCSYTIQDFRLKYEFEKEITNSMNKLKISKNDCEEIYAELNKDWRLKSEIVKHFVKNIYRKVRTNDLFGGKWWPERKSLPKAFYKRKHGSLSLIEYFHTNLTMDKTRRKMIMSGGGGVGKSATSIWFALEYEKNFDHVIWLDCGVGSLQESFRRLARGLKLEDWNIMVVEDLAIGCFKVLKDFHCLIIYDNAECYNGKDGIKNVLPENSDNHHVIITSRNKEWGNSTGLGEIRRFSIDIFNEAEALEFMKASIYNFRPENKYDLFELCDRLGYLPLALQIAIATINQHEMSICDYTVRIRKTDGLIETPCDYYENNINKTMSVSLDLIQAMDRSAGKWAHRILNVFCYVTAVNVQIGFFTALEKNADIEIMKEAAELLEKYSLVAFNKNNSSLSIHPLLQQVIRYNNNRWKKDALRKILKGVGFLEYKLIPYSFADEELRKEFPEIKSELIDKLELKKLLTDGRFQEAVELSLLINEECPSLTSLYNYAYCLQRNKENIQAKSLFEDLYAKVHNINVQCPSIQGILSLFDIVHGKIVGGHLLKIYLQSEQKQKALEVIKKSGAVFECGVEDLNDVIKLFNSISNCNFRYDGDIGSFSVTYIPGQRNENHFELSNCFVNDETFNDCALQQLTLRRVSTSPNFFNCVSFLHIQTFSLSDMEIELPHNFTAEKVTLGNVTVLNWIRAKWTVKELILKKVYFLEKTEMNVEKVTIYNSSVDASVFPNNTKKIFLNNTHIVNCSVSSVDNSLEMELPHHLEELHFINVTFEDCAGENIERVDISSSIPPNLNRLTLNADNFANPWTVLLDCVRSIPYLNFVNCAVVQTSENWISSKELSIEDVAFLGINKDHPGKTNLANQFVDCSQMQKLTLGGQNWAVDISDDLWEFNFLEWKNPECGVNQIILKGADSAQQMKLRVNDFKIAGIETLFDFSNLSQQFNLLVKLELTECVISNWSQRVMDKIKLPSTLQVFTIDRVRFKDGNGNNLDPKEISISSLIAPSVKKLKVFTPVQINIHNLVTIPYLELKYCSLIKYAKVRLRPIELKLDNVKILEPYYFFWSRESEKVSLNDLVDFKQMQKLYLNGENLSLVMSDHKVCVKEVTLLNAKNVKWKNIKWTINELHLHFSLRQTFTYIPSPSMKSVKNIYCTFGDNNLEIDQNQQNSLKADSLHFDFCLDHF